MMSTVTAATTRAQGDGNSSRPPLELRAPLGWRLLSENERRVPGASPDFIEEIEMTGIAHPAELLDRNDGADFLFDTLMSLPHYQHMMWFSTDIILGYSRGFVESTLPQLEANNFQPCMSIHLTTNYSDIIMVYIRGDNMETIQVPDTISILMQLCFRRTALETIHFYLSMYDLILNDNFVPGPFPLSPSALEAIITTATAVATDESPIDVHFEMFPFSIEQWRALVFHCPSHVRLCVDDHDIRHNPVASWKLFVQAVTDSLDRDGATRPSRLKVTFPVTDSAAPLLLSKFASTLQKPACVLKDLELTLQENYNEPPALEREIVYSYTTSLRGLVQAIRNNQSLERLTVHLHCYEYNRNHQEGWNLWHAVALHPNLQSFDLMICAPPLTVDQEEALWDSLRHNQVLCHLDWLAKEICRHLEPKVQSLLKLNQFRPLLRDSQQVADPTERHGRLTRLLLDDTVCNDLDRIYLLVRMNYGWLKEKMTSSVGT